MDNGFALKLVITSNMLSVLAVAQLRARIVINNSCQVGDVCMRGR